MATTMKIFSFALLFVIIFSIDEVKGAKDPCCENFHLEFGICSNKAEGGKCDAWCRASCKGAKGGFCKPRSPHVQHCCCYY